MTNEQLVLRIRAGENVAENMLTLWQQCRVIIVELARKYSAVAEQEDLEQEAYFAISKAVDSYDHEKGASFLTWARFWISAADGKVHTESWYRKASCPLRGTHSEVQRAAERVSDADRQASDSHGVLLLPGLFGGGSTGYSEGGADAENWKS